MSWEVKDDQGLIPLLEQWAKTIWGQCARRVREVKRGSHGVILLVKSRPQDDYNRGSHLPRQRDLNIQSVSGNRALFKMSEMTCQVAVSVR